MYRNLHATGNISADGNIALGDADTDSIDFNAEIASNIIPNASNTYNLGTSTKAWNNVHVENVNGPTINAQTANIAGINLGTRHANTLYVREKMVAITTRETFPDLDLRKQYKMQQQEIQYTFAPMFI